MRIAIGVPFDVKVGNDSGFLTAFNNLKEALSRHNLVIYAPNGGDIKLNFNNKRGNVLTKKYYNTLSLAKDFAKKIEKEKFDLIIAFTNMGLFLKKEHIYFTSNPPYKKILKLVKNEFQKSPKFQKLIKYYRLIANTEEKSYRKAKKIFVYSTEIKKAIVEEYNIPSSKIIYLPRHIENKSFKIKRREEKIKLIVMPSRPIIMKGIKNAIETMKILKKRYPSAILLILGKTSNYEEEYLNNLLKKSRKKANIFLSGKLKKEEFYEYLKNADCAFMPFLYDECPIALTECLSFNLPIVTNKYAGYSKEVINRFGKCVETNKSKDYANEIIKLLENKNLKKQKIKNIQRIQKKYTTKNFKRKLNYELSKISKTKD